MNLILTSGLHMHRPHPVQILDIYSHTFNTETQTHAHTKVTQTNIYPNHGQ